LSLNTASGLKLAAHMLLSIALEVPHFYRMLVCCSHREMRKCWVAAL